MITSNSMGMPLVQPLNRVPVSVESAVAPSAEDQSFSETLSSRLDSASVRDPGPSSAHDLPANQGVPFGAITDAESQPVQSVSGDSGEVAGKKAPQGPPATTSVAQSGPAARKVLSRPQPRAAATAPAKPAGPRKSSTQDKDSAAPAGVVVSNVPVAAAGGPATLPTKPVRGGGTEKVCATPGVGASAKASLTSRAASTAPSKQPAALAAGAAASGVVGIAVAKHAEPGSEPGAQTGSEHETGAAPTVSENGGSVVPAVSIAHTAPAHTAPITAAPNASADLPAKLTDHGMTAASEPAQPGGARTLEATSNALEVGVSSGTHGWLRVRAELSQSGVVTAALVASSASSAESLSRHLPEMSQYLAQESTTIGSLVVHASAGSSAAARAGDGSQAAAQAGAGQGGASSDGRSEQSASQPRQAYLADAASGSLPGHMSGIEGMWPALAGGSSAGYGGSATHWVNVRV